MRARKISSAALDQGKQGKEFKLEGKVQIQFESRGEVRGMEWKVLKLEVKEPSEDSSQVPTDRSLLNRGRCQFASQQIGTYFDQVYST